MTRPPLKAPKLYSPAEAAAVLGIDVATLRKHVKAGRVPARRLPSGHRRFESAAIDAMATPMNEATGEPWAK